MLDLLGESPCWLKCPAEQSCYRMLSAGSCLAFALKVACMHRGYTLPAVWLTCKGNSDRVSLLRLRVAKILCSGWPKILLHSGLSVLRLYASVTLRGEPHVGQAHRLAGKGILVPHAPSNTCAVSAYSCKVHLHKDLPRHVTSRFSATCNETDKYFRS